MNQVGRAGGRDWVTQAHGKPAAVRQGEGEAREALRRADSQRGRKKGRRWGSRGSEVSEPPPSPDPALY